MNHQLLSPVNCIPASLKYLGEYRDFLNSYLRDDQQYYTNLRQCFEMPSIRRSIQRLVEFQIRWGNGESLPEGWVPFKTLWLLNDGKIVGEAVVRIGSLPIIEKFSGNITYYILPSFRQQGLGRRFFTQVLSFALADLSRVLVTCSRDNGYSLSIIEKAGGRFIDEVDNFPDWGEITRRYQFLAAV